ncbi:MAG TPA: serine/threonine-protein kinase, partial [Steroidobacteraceae bacterium]
DLPQEAHEHWLARLGPADLPLEPVLRDLLAKHAAAETSDFLNTLPKFAATALHADAGALEPGTLIGPYVLEAEVGRGGMGVVYRAVRADGLIKRPVAIKLLHPGLQGDEFVARFALERDILARLAHPNIARLYDAGLTPARQPYLALEFVAGTPIIDYSDQRHLTLAARLELFEQVLSAVQFAHANLVVHRDLKPSNILVTDSGEVRLLDFGIARLLSAGGGSDASPLTEVGIRAMTPDYSAPEQILGEALTTATDVYSIGVVLFELLTGARPYRLARRSRGALEEAIVDLMPLSPSRVPMSLEVAIQRGTTPVKLRRALQGDLDTILLKCLKKEPRARYATIDALREDLRRYRDHEPVLARPDRPLYRIRKFIARYKLPVALASALVLASVTGLCAALWALNSARAQAARAEVAKGFLIKVFSSGNPSNTDGKNITASEILERGSHQMDLELRAQPLLLAELHSEISDIYSSLGANEDMLAHARKSLELLDTVGGHSSEVYFNVLYRIADAYMEEGRWPQARVAYQRLRTEAAARYGALNHWEGKALEDLIEIERETGALPAAAAAATQALAVDKALFGEHSAAYLRVLGSSEQLYLDRGEPRRALELTRRLIALAPSVPEYALADRLMDRYMLGSTLYRLQRYQESAEELRRLVPDMERNMGASNDRTCKARNTLALDLMQLGELEEALTIQRHNLDILQHAGNGDQETLTGQTATLARILARKDEYAEALRIQQHVVDYYDQLYRTPKPITEYFRASLGDMLVRNGDFEQGLVQLRAAIHNLDSIEGYGPDPNYADAVLAMGNALRLLGNTAEAQAAFARARALYLATLGGAPSLAVLRCRLYEMLDSIQHGRTADLASVRDEMLTMLAPHQVLRAEILLIEADLDRRDGRLKDADANQRRGIQLYKSLVGTDPQLPLRALH